MPRAVRLSLSGVLALAFAVGLPFFATRAPSGEVVDETTGTPGWKTVEYEGVRVDIPADWVRWDTSDCEFQFERWGPPGFPACELNAGLGFYGSATFDPSHRPGAQRRDEPPRQNAPTWAGYVYAGDYAVDASDDSREVVATILASAE